MGADGKHWIWSKKVDECQIADRFIFAKRMTHSGLNDPNRPLVNLRHQRKIAVGAQCLHLPAPGFLLFES